MTFAVLYYGFCSGLVSDSGVADTPEEDARFQLEEENVLKVIF